MTGSRHTFSLGGVRTEIRLSEGNTLEPQNLLWMKDESPLEIALQTKIIILNQNNS